MIDFIYNGLIAQARPLDDNHLPSIIINKKIIGPLLILVYLTYVSLSQVRPY